MIAVLNNCEARLNDDKKCIEYSFDEGGTRRIIRIGIDNEKARSSTVYCEKHRTAVVHIPVFMEAIKTQAESDKDLSFYIKMNIYIMSIINKFADLIFPDDAGDFLYCPYCNNDIEYLDNDDEDDEDGFTYF